MPARTSRRPADPRALCRGTDSLRSFRHIHRIALLTLAGLSVAACAGQRPSSPATGGDPPPAAAYRPVIDPARFTDRVTNPYLPLTPGTTQVYQGAADGASEVDQVVVTRDTKVVLGVRCVVVHHTVNHPRGLAEDTYDWYAQDSHGNVWYFGESTVAYQPDGSTSREGSWQAGVDGAQPGLVMEGAPKVGDTYRQEYDRGHAEDMARVIGLGEAVTLPLGSFRDTVVTEETTPLEPGKVERKLYARGVGMTSLTMTRGGSEHLELVRVTAG